VGKCSTALFFFFPLLFLPPFFSLAIYESGFIRLFFFSFYLRTRAHKRSKEREARLFPSFRRRSESPGSFLSLFPPTKIADEVVEGKPLLLYLLPLPFSADGGEEKRRIFLPYGFGVSKRSLFPRLGRFRRSADSFPYSWFGEKG